MRLETKVLDITTNHVSAKLLIKGQVRHEGVPVSCEVAVLNRASKKLISKAQSRVDGVFVVHGSRLYPNIVIAIDPYNDHNIAAQDNVK